MLQLGRSIFTISTDLGPTATQSRTSITTSLLQKCEATSMATRASVRVNGDALAALGEATHALVCDFRKATQLQHC